MQDQGAASENRPGWVTRSWALSQIERWLDAGESQSPVMLIHGNPGTGKSTLLEQVLGRSRSLASVKVLHKVLRGPSAQDAFDDGRLIAAISELAGGSADTFSAQGHLHETRIEVSQEGTSIQGNMIGVAILGASLVQGAARSTALARVRACATEGPLQLIIVDALDQAEDEGAGEFLATLSGIARSAVGSRVRILCASRTSSSIWLESQSLRLLDLDSDPDVDAEIERLVRSTLLALDEALVDDILPRLLRGAEGNWLWAETNSRRVLHEFNTYGQVPSSLGFSPGLTGLYEDGIRRIRQQVSRAIFDDEALPLIGVVAASFARGMAVSELRWVTNIPGTHLETLLKKCEPLLVTDQYDNVQTFHPDFSRWVLAGNLNGVREEVEHYRIASGLTRLINQRAARQPISEYAARWVLDHWMSFLVLDPFAAEKEMAESAIADLICNPAWVDSTSATFDDLNLLARVSPKLCCPSQDGVTLLTIRKVSDSGEATLLGGLGVLAATASDRKGALMDLVATSLSETGPWSERYRRGAARIHQDFPNVGSLTFRIVWKSIVLGYLVWDPRGRGEWRLHPRMVSAMLDKSTPFDGPGWSTDALHSLIAEFDAARLTEVLEVLSVRAQSDNDTLWAVAEVSSRLFQLERQTGGSGNANAALGAYRKLLEVQTSSNDVGSVFPLTTAAALADLLRQLPDPSLEEAEELVNIQRQILEARLDSHDERWLSSSILLGDALRALAGLVEEKDRRGALMTEAVGAYRRSLAATPANHEQRLRRCVPLANALLALFSWGGLSLADAEELVQLQREISQALHAAGDERWPQASNILGDSLRILTDLVPLDHQKRALTAEAVEAYRQSLVDTPIDHEDRLSRSVDLADALIALSALGGLARPQAEELVQLQRGLSRELHDRGDDGWPTSSSGLGDALRVLSQYVDDEQQQRELTHEAVEAYRQTLAATSSGQQERLSRAIDLADALIALLALGGLDRSQAEELVQLQREISQTLRNSGDEQWTQATNLLGYALRALADLETEEDQAQALTAEAVEVYQQALVATPEGHESHLSRSVDLTNALFALYSLSGLTRPQGEELVRLRRSIYEELHGSGDERWPKAANRFGDALRVMATLVDVEDQKQPLIAESVEVYRQALVATSPGHEERLMRSMDLANALLELYPLSGLNRPQAEELVQLQRGISRTLRDLGEDSWRQSAGLLGDALRVLADLVDEEDRKQVLASAAVEAYRQALAAAAGDVGERVERSVRLADALGALHSMGVFTRPQAEELVQLRREVLQAFRDSGDERWPRAADMLGNALRALGDLMDEEEQAQALIVESLEAYRQALAATPAGHDRLLERSIHLANALISLLSTGGLSRTQAEDLVQLQRTIFRARADSGDELAPQAASVLGDALRVLADLVDDEKQAQALTAEAVEAYRQAFLATSAGHPQRLRRSVDLANAMVLNAIWTGTQTVDALNEAIEIVDQQILEAAEPSVELRRLLPVLSARLRRRGSL